MCVCVSALLLSVLVGVYCISYVGMLMLPGETCEESVSMIFGGSNVGSAPWSRFNEFRKKNSPQISHVEEEILISSARRFERW